MCLFGSLILAVESRIKFYDPAVQYRHPERLAVLVVNVAKVKTRLITIHVATTDVNAGHERGPFSLYSGCLPAYDTSVKVDKRSFNNHTLAANNEFTLCSITWYTVDPTPPSDRSSMSKCACGTSIVLTI